MPKLHEAKTILVLRTLLSFALFCTIVLLSLSVCGKTVWFNKSLIEQSFQSYDYVESVKSSTVEYVNDVYLRNGLDNKNIKDIITYDQIKEIVKAYVSSTIGAGTEYNETTYSEDIDNICNAIEKDINTQVKEKQLQSNGKAVGEIKKTVNEFINSEIEIDTGELKSSLNMLRIADIVVLCVSLFFTVSFALILVFLGDSARRYRSIRAVGVSCYSAGVFNIILSIVLTIIFSIKKIDIFPIYLRNVVMDYINTCILSIVFAAVILLFVGIVASVLIWKIRKVRFQR